MFEVGYIVKWTDRKKRVLQEKYREIRFEVVFIEDAGSIIMRTLPDFDESLNLKTNNSSVLRDIHFERKIKISKLKRSE